MAGPHVVGEVALLWSADPTLRGDITGTVDVIRATSKPKTTTQRCGGVAGSSIPNNTYGYGLIDAYKAVKSRMTACSGVLVDDEQSHLVASQSAVFWRPRCRGRHLRQM